MPKGDKRPWGQRTLFHLLGAVLFFLLVFDTIFWHPEKPCCSYAQSLQGLCLRAHFWIRIVTKSCLCCTSWVFLLQKQWRICAPAKHISLSWPVEIHSFGTCRSSCIVSELMWSLRTLWSVYRLMCSLSSMS